MRLRDQCSECPWRNTDELIPPEVVEHARTNLDGFVCHMRCGPCDGPRIALKLTAEPRGDFTDVARGSRTS